MKAIKTRLLLSAWVFLALAGYGYAQESTTGSIAGEVVDTQGARLPGASVTITSDQGAKTVVADRDGRFFAPFLTPGVYAVRVELAGFSPIERKNVEVRLGQRVPLDFTLKVGEIEETVEVVGTAPVINTSSTTSGGVLSSDELKKLPIGRGFTESLYLVPGVSDSSGVGRQNPSVSGASGLENNYIVDGVNISNTGFGGIGTYSIVFGSLGTAVTTDFIKETQVKTAGFEAEYGQATGGVVNVVTKSGTNEFHGSVYGFASSGGLESGWNQLQTPNGTVNTTATENYDFGVNLGFPLVKNKLFFFGAAGPQYQRRTFIAPEDFPLRDLGEVERRRRVYSYAGKLTWQLSNDHRIDVSAFGDPSRGESGPQRFTALLATRNTRFSTIDTYGTHSQTLRYDGVLMPSWLVEGSVARATNSLNEVPATDEWQVTDRTVVPNVPMGGIGFFDKGGAGTNLQFALKSTHIFNAGGQHQIRYGAQFEDIDYEREFGRTGPPITLSNGIVTRTGASAVSILPDPVFGRIWRVARANFGPVPATVQKYTSTFIQDTWNIGNKLTIRPGVRWERQRLVGGGTPLCFANDSQPGRGDGSGDPVQCEYTWDNNWGPRIGAIYDPTGNGKAKIFASWGRFYSKIPNDLAARALSADAGISRADYFDAGLTQPVPDGVLAAGVTQHLVIAGLHAAVFAPETDSTYQDEFSGGLEYEVASNLSLGVRYIRRTLPSILEDYQPAPIVAFDLGCPGADTVEYFIDNISASLPRFTCAGVPDSSFEDPAHNYDSFEFTANKRFSNNWGLIASYRFAKLDGNFEGFFRSDNGQSDPAITSLFDFPTNDPSYTQIGASQFGYQGDIRFQGVTLGSGVLPNDRPHQFKIYGNYTFRSLNVGLGFNAGSGRSLTSFAANPNYQNAGEIPVTVRGGGFETADGLKDRVDFETSLDLHADYTFKLSGRTNLVLVADAFNLFNRQEPLDYDNYIDLGLGAPNPNFGLPLNGGANGAPGFQDPRRVRVGARIEW